VNVTLGLGLLYVTLLLPRQSKIIRVVMYISSARWPARLRPSTRCVRIVSTYRTMKVYETSHCHYWCYDARRSSTRRRKTSRRRSPGVSTTVILQGPASWHWKRWRKQGDDRLGSVVKQPRQKYFMTITTRKVRFINFAD